MAVKKLKRANLTPKQEEVVRFVKSYYKKNDYPPTIREIADYFDRAISTIHKRIVQLQKKGYLQKSDYQARNITPLEKDKFGVEVPVLGTITAGKPIYAFEEPEPTYVPTTLISNPSNHYALKVSGDSMIENNIQDGDLVLIRHQNDASIGDVIVGILDNKATLKRYGGFKNGKYILIPKNNQVEKIEVDPERFQIRGKYLGLIRHVDN